MRKTTPLEVIVVSFEAGHVMGTFDAEGYDEELVVVLVDGDAVDHEVVVGVEVETVLGGQRLTLLAVVVCPSAPPEVAELVLATGRIDCRTLLEGGGVPAVVVYTWT